jgi:hypothetical protein
MAYTPFIFASDIHGDCQDTAACNALFRFMRDWKPKIRVCGGDLWDFRALRKKASKKETEESTKADLAAGMSFLDAFKPTHFLRGNHDERLWDAAKDGGTQDGLAKDYAAEKVEAIETKLAGWRCTMLPYHNRRGVLKIGHLKFIHGFFCGVTAARQHALAYGSCVFGHGHAIDVASAPGFDRRVARMVGCLCSLDMDYSRASVGALRYASGWAYGVIDERSGDYQVWQAEGINGKFVVAGEPQVIVA